jgi:hypothetical protein
MIALEMLPIPPRDESAHRDESPGHADFVKKSRAHFQARVGFALPLLAWFSQLFLATNARQVPAEGHLLAAIAQCVLLILGLMFAVSALDRRGRGETGVLIPAIIGLMISGGTLLLVVVMAFATMLG